MKIDVEGASFHVLEGFGDQIKNVKCIQIEAEHDKWAIIPYEKISELLLEKEFELVHFKRIMGSGADMKQSDSFWVKKEHVKYP